MNATDLSNPTVSAPAPVSSPVIPDDVASLRRQLESTQSAFVSTLMEKNFLQRALADLNFHHNAHDGIVFTDDQNRVVYANPYFLKMMNITDPADLLGKALPSYMWHSPDDPKNLFEDVRTNGFVRERELNLYDSHNQPVFAACSSVASKDNTGKFVGTEIMLCNITSKRNLQVQLAERTQALERAAEFCHQCLEDLTEIVERKAPHQEMVGILRNMKKQLEEAKFVQK